MFHASPYHHDKFKIGIQGTGIVLKNGISVMSMAAAYSAKWCLQGIVSQNVIKFHRDVEQDSNAAMQSTNSFHECQLLQI